jgi:hypothetical protein
MVQAKKEITAVDQAKVDAQPKKPAAKIAKAVAAKVGGPK